MTERYRCSVASSEQDEPLHGTASQVRRWILVEQPGPWGREAITDSRLDAKTAAGLMEIAALVNARVLLVRRHGRYSPAVRACLVAVTAPNVHWLEELIVEDPSDLLEVDWSPLAVQRSVGGRPVSGNHYLVCTNGRHDPCCAEYGRPVAALLSATFPERVWECSHIGGDRFAPNIVTLPDGTYYGRVDPRKAAELIHRHDGGQLTLPAWRGTSSSPFVAQSAEYFLRREEGLEGIGDVVFEASRRAGDLFEVAFSGAAGGWLVTVRSTEAEPSHLTCQATKALRPPRFELVAIQPGAG